MKISLAFKLFSVLLLTCIAVFAAQAIILRISVQEDFFDYLNFQEQDRISEALPRFANAYREHGNWNFLKGDLRTFLGLILQQPDLEVQRGELPIAEQTGAGVRMGLLDIHLKRIAGNQLLDENSVRRPIVVGGEVVGWLGIVPIQRVLSPNEALFLAKQRKTWLIFGSISVLLIALLTFVLSRPVRRRMHSLARATRQLAGGDYRIRIPVETIDEIGALAQDFNRLAQALELNERARRTFMADISHELRTPLAVVRAELEAVQDGVREPNAQVLQAMHQEVKQLGKLIDDFNDLALTDVGALTYRRTSVDVVMILNTALNSMLGRFASAGLLLEREIVDNHLIISGDERRLLQLFSNILENTLRYTDAAGHVRIACKSTGRSVQITMEDSAPGVPADKLPFLFERFYRVDESRNRASGGSGLGLAICRNIVEAHEGRITVHPSALGGLRLTIELELSIQ
ncbi:MAG: ATP-binding protein [Burkholderiaceae bacterium]|nr:ATP-binding protein [Burkholderiaceae bacterium]